MRKVVCLFVRGFTSYLRIFHSDGDVTITGKGLKNLCSALMVFEQWCFFSVPHLMWHGTSVYQGPVTLSPIAEHLAVKLSLHVFTTVAAGIRTLNLPIRGEHSHPLPRRRYQEVTSWCQSLPNTESTSSYKCRCFVNWFRRKFAKMDEIFSANRVTNENHIHKKVINKKNNDMYWIIWARTY